MLTVQHADGQYLLILDDGESLHAQSAEKLVATANSLGDDDPFRLPPGSRLHLDLSKADRADVLLAMRPARPELQVAEKEELPEVEGDDAYWEPGQQAQDDDIRLDGQSWGWYWLAHVSDYRSEKGGRFVLAPLGGASELLHMSAWMSASMTGATISAGLKHWQGLAGVGWCDADEGPSFRRAFYPLLDTEEVSRACLAVIDAFKEQTVRVCPDENCDPGWEFGLSGQVPDATLAQAVGAMYEPCEAHASDYGTNGDWVVELGGAKWKWIDGGWRRHWTDAE